VIVVLIVSKILPGALYNKLLYEFCSRVSTVMCLLLQEMKINARLKNANGSFKIRKTAELRIRI